MRKADSLRQHLTQWLPDLKAHPDRLAVYLESGQVRTRLSKTPSFGYAYTLKIGLWDFAGSADSVIVPLLAWIEREQPQLLRKADSQPFTFEAELLDSGAYDLLISIDLGETVLVIPRADGSGYDVQHPPEPDFTDAFAGANPPPLLWQLFAATDLLLESQDPAATLTPAIPPDA
jgi:hypothetical protein